MKRRLALVLLTSLLATAPIAARADAESPNVGLKILDISLVRPVSMLLSFASTGAFLGISPLATCMGIEDETARVMVLAPWRYTSAREIGSFDRYRDGGDIFENLDRAARRVRW